MHFRLNFLFRFLFLSLLLAGCIAPAPVVNPTSTPAVLPVPTTAAGPVSGPWLVIPGPDGIWAYDTTAETLQLIETRHLLAPQDVTAMPSPDGQYIAYITGENGIDNLALNIRSLPDGGLHTLPLVDEEYLPPPGALPGDPSARAVRALFEDTSIAWSPDGSALVFTAILERPEADLYVVHVDDLAGLPLRLTNGSGSAFRPIWSVDGRAVIYQAVESFGSGAGYTLAGVWAVQTDGSGARLLYEAPISGGESFAGWADEETLRIYSWTPVCGRQDLRMVNVTTGAESSAWDGPFSGLAFDPNSGGMLLAVDLYTSNCEGAAGQGLYLLAAGGGDPVQLLEEEAFLPLWDAAAGVYFVRTVTKIYSVNPAALPHVTALQAPEPTLPVANREGRLAWTSAQTGVWIGKSGEASLQIFNRPAFTPAWSQDGTLLFFFGELGFYRMSVVDFEVELVGEGLVSGGAFWVNP